ncbi:transmembrane protein 63 isoform X1 [Brevipalpus obovatus]|uniref:transmembrane protein 63 isoform X1 n=1 Tax=Brevipalpus obovatus TaxID=246614 RepID=UPI003D9DCCAE
MMIMLSDLSKNGTSQNDTCGNMVSNQSDQWASIPFYFSINSVIFFLMILLFALLRNKAWNRRSGRLNRTRRGWLQFIYGDRETRSEPKKPMFHTEHHEHHQKYNHLLFPPTLSDMTLHSEVNENIEICVDMQIEPEDGSVNGVASSGSGELETHLSFHSRQNVNRFNDTPDQANGIGDDDKQTTVRRPRSVFDRSMSTTEFGHLLYDILFIKDQDILGKKGSDAVQYLLFQRYIIYFLFFLTFICLVIVLPINLQGTEGYKLTAFGRTTVSSITGDSNLLWAHVVISILILPISMLFMCHFSKTIKAEEQRIVKRTLYVRRVPKTKRSKDQLIDYLHLRFPDVSIEGMQFVYNTHRLRSLHYDYNNVVNAKYFCEEYQNEYHKRCEIYPYFLGHLGPYACCGCHKADGINHYETREQELEREIEKEFRDCISEPSGSVFVTFQTEKMAQKVYRELRKAQDESCTLFPCNCCFRLGTWLKKLCNCHDSDEFETSRWLVSYAPYPDDINWDDIEIDYKLIWIRRILIHLLLFVIFFFLSTPSIILSILTHLKIKETIDEGLKRMNPLAADYLSPLLMVIAAIILPSFVTLASRYLPYKTLSNLNHSIMWKVFLFLTMMVVILPSLGLSSAASIWGFDTDKKFNWRCLFPVDNGAFFVNYVLQSALLGNAMELLRFPELFLYFFYYTFFSQTPAEYENARQQVIFDFQFGIRYPRFLLIFCMVVTYSLSCPLIAPCGLLYMIIKHLVDRYNIYFVYTPSRINPRIHSTAIAFFHIGILMMIFQVFTFCYIRTGDGTVTKVALLLVMVAFFIFCGNCLVHCFFSFTHLVYGATIRRVTKKDNAKEFCACSYLPPVLFDLNVNGIVPPESQSGARNYGSLTPSDRLDVDKTTSMTTHDSSQDLNAATSSK